MPRVRIGVDARPLAGPRSGTARYLSSILEQWEAMGVDAQIYLYAEKDFYWPYSGPRWQIKVSRPLFMPSTCWAFSYGVRQMKKDKIDVFWAPWPIIPFFMPIKKAVTILDFVWKRYPETMRWPMLQLFRLLGDISLKKADIIFPISRSVSSDLKKYFPNAKNIHLSLCSAGPCFRALGKEKARAIIVNKYSLPGQFILSVGTIEPRKNLEGLFRAFRKFRDMGECCCKLVVVGSYGWKNSGVFNLCKELGLQDEIIFTGYVEDQDLANFYNAAEFFVYPSFYEGFGIPLLEAMASGCPVIASNRPAMPEVAGEAALFVDPEDTDDIAHKMFRMMTEDTLRQQYRLKGLERSKAFSWRATAENVFKVLIGDGSP